MRGKAEHDGTDILRRAQDPDATVVIFPSDHSVHPEAIEAYLESLKKDHLPIPPAVDPEIASVRVRA